MAYLLIFPFQAANGYLMRSRRKNQTSAEVTKATSDQSDD